MHWAYILMFRGIQGNKLKSKNEIKISDVFRKSPEPFLNMIIVHELAHLKEKEHNKAFYKLCCHMLSNYYQLEVRYASIFDRIEVKWRTILTNIVTSCFFIENEFFSYHFNPLITITKTRSKNCK